MLGLLEILITSLLPLLPDQLLPGVVALVYMYKNGFGLK